jgi:hypothetical protein
MPNAMSSGIIFVGITSVTSETSVSSTVGICSFSNRDVTIPPFHSGREEENVVSSSS